MNKTTMQQYNKKPLLPVSIVLTEDSATETNIKNILNQTHKIKFLTLANPINPTPLMKACCCLGMGKLSLLVKERDSDTILLFSVPNKVILSSPGDLLKLVTQFDGTNNVHRGRNCICFRTNIGMSIDDLYSNKYGNLWI